MNYLARIYEIIGGIIGGIFLLIIFLLIVVYLLHEIPIWINSWLNSDFMVIYGVHITMQQAIILTIGFILVGGEEGYRRTR